jgi:Helix-turn-helix domain
MPPSGLKPHSGRSLTFAEREEIAICRAYGFGIREIARHLGRSASTISRELRRNAATRAGTLHYRAVVAQWKAERQTCRPKVSKLAVNERLREYVLDRLSGTVTAPDGTPILGPEVRFSTSHTPSKSGPRPLFIPAITVASWSILRSRSCGVQPTMSFLIARNTLSVRRPSATASSSSNRFSTFHHAR